ncbi:LITAF-like zinc ribbon domain-containing protein [Massariosphaeria phaeospora]|uniref:LITAF-like zinc ribbon domain-containing protein n=1 Tax=Massariosphaeria phaeospora TaxID=100035 RepID=A0A7C8M2Y6_9PLEO|nr:LITAF-like zinc ribbon domain-containing protein [Massariosphaeria phaeospora]
MEKQGVPMNQFPQSPDVTQQQPPVYHQDPNAQQYQQQAPVYQQPQQQPSYAGSPAPQQGYGSQIPPTQAQHVAPQQAPQQQQQQHPGMPPQQQTGQIYQNVTPIPSLNRSPAPADCPACGQRAMTNVAFEVGNTTHAWALGICCFTLCLGFIPYVMNSLKDVQHKCGRCGVLLATWHRSGTTEVHIHA